VEGNTEITPEQRLQIERLKREAMRKILTKEAMERLSRIKLANPVLAEQVEIYFLQLFQQGQMKTQITEEKLKQILTLATKKKESKITIRRG